MAKDLTDIQLADGGPLYKETNFDNWIVEPWNTASAIIFIGIAIYWGIKLYQAGIKKHLFMSICTLILLTGGIGGTIYHAFRDSNFFLQLDYIPIIILCITSSIYFLLKVVKQKWLAVVCFIFFILSHIALSTSMEKGIISPGWGINISYFLLASYITVPTYLFMKKTQFVHSKYVYRAILVFCFALFSRIIDLRLSFDFLPMGTHWLWHSFGALACHQMFNYLFYTNQHERD